ncbi:MAG: hypothetical protein HY917_04575 [Candidatus Diapherotrites archaeon]|nr:hypothetical protein [Candidatus Diapherotrites archaeon]
MGAARMRKMVSGVFRRVPLVERMFSRSALFLDSELSDVKSSLQRQQERTLLKRPLKPSSEVESLRIIREEGDRLFRLGGYMTGDVFLGRIKFRGGSPNRVAIKLFHQPLTDERAGEYVAAIDALRAAGVQLPKMGLIKVGVPVIDMASLKMDQTRLRGTEWVQVSELFGSARVGSKIVNKSSFILPDVRSKLEAVAEMTKVANAGYCPVSDLVEPFKRRKGAPGLLGAFIKRPSGGIIPIDLDRVVEWGPVPASFRTDFLSKRIEELGTSRALVRRLYALALHVASPEVAAALQPYYAQIRKKYGF